MAERLTARRLNRATLARQLLLERARLGVVEAVRKVVALQAQEPASPYLALWNRVAGFDPKDLDRAFATHEVVKATLMRLTMHAVAAGDYALLHEAMARTHRAARLGDERFTVAGLSIAETDALIPPLVEFMAEPRSSDDVRAWLDERLGPPSRAGAWWALRHYGPFVHAATGGPWSFKRRAYVAAPDQARSGDEQTALRWLVRRYLEGFGPATVSDIRQFGMLYAGPMKQAVRSLLDEGEVVSLDGPGRAELLDVPNGPLPDEDTPAPPRLLGMFDEILLVYADRSRVISPEHRTHVARVNGDSLPTLLVDGYVAGVWRPVEDGIEATAFDHLSDDAWAGLASEARGLKSLLADREPLPYRRYMHWFEKLPRAAEVSLL